MARYTGFTDFKGQPINEGDFVYIPRTVFNLEFVGIVKWVEKMQRWEVYRREPWGVYEPLEPHIVNVYPSRWTAAHKVTDPELIELYR